MKNESRHKRLRLLIKTLNRNRKKQKRQIDLLCHDLIGAQRDFIQRLDTISLAAGVYKSLLGITDLEVLLHTITEQMVEVVPVAHISFFLRHSQHVRHFSTEQVTPKAEDRLEPFFTEEVIDAVCRVNKICRWDDLLGMGLQVRPGLAGNLSVATVPLLQGCRCVGFILLTTPSSVPLHNDQLAKIEFMSSGLTTAIMALEKVSRSA